MSVQCSRQAAVGWKISSKFEADPQLNLIAAGTAQYEACCSLGHDHLKGLRLLEKRSEKYLGISRRGCFRVATWLVSNGSERKGFQSSCPLTREAISSFHLAGTSRRLEISGDIWRSIKTGDIWEALHRHWLRRTRERTPSLGPKFICVACHGHIGHIGHIGHVAMWPSGGSWPWRNNFGVLLCTNEPPNEVNKYLNPIAIAWPDFNFLNPVCSSDSFQWPDSIQGVFAYWTHSKGILCQSTQLKLL